MSSPSAHLATEQAPSRVQPSEGLPAEQQENPAHTTDVADFDDQELEADLTDDTDSAFGSSVGSDTTSIATHYKGYFENGRRYQSVRNDEYITPSDDKQWVSMDQAHLLLLILDSHQDNPYFRSPISEKVQNIIDLGTGTGTWAQDVADRFPNITVRGVDLFPPPQTLASPNCIFEVDDITKPWTWNVKFDLVHIRNLLGGLNDADWKRVYKRAYDNLAPGGWIEQVEQDIGMFCDDDTLPKDSLVAKFKEFLLPIGIAADRPLETRLMMKSRIEAAGFVNVHVQDYKIPLGTWPKLPVYKDAGRIGAKMFKLGMEGWVMWLLTKFGTPQPWSIEEVTVYVAKIRQEIDAGYHIYNPARRVWAQKPYETAQTSQKAVLENVAEGSPSPTQPAKKQKTEGGNLAEEA